MLGVSVLVSTYCQSLGEGAFAECADVPEVREAVVRYEERLGVNCYAMGREEEDNVVLALKGIGTNAKVRRKAVAINYFTPCSSEEHRLHPIFRRHSPPLLRGGHQPHGDQTGRHRHGQEAGLSVGRSQPEGIAGKGAKAANVVFYKN